MSELSVNVGRYYADNHPKCATCSHKLTHEVTFYGMMSDFPIEVPIDYSHFAKKELATKTLKRLAEVMS